MAILENQDIKTEIAKWKAKSIEKILREDYGIESVHDFIYSHSFKLGLFYVGYFIDDKWKLYKIYYVDDNRWKIDISNINNPAVLWIILYNLFENKKLDKIKLEEVKVDNLTIKDLKKIIEEAFFYRNRELFMYLKDDEIKNIRNLVNNLEKFYRKWWLTFLDILKFYLNWWIWDKEFKMFMDKVIREEYLSRQLWDIRFYRLFQNLNADKKSAKEFLENIKWKSLKEIINDPTYWNPEGLFNLYVWMVILKTLKEKGVISEEDYRRYEKTIVEMIKRIEEDKEVVRRLEEKKQKEKDKNIDKYRQKLNDFLDKMRR